MSQAEVDAANKLIIDINNIANETKISKKDII
jgi:hypothetical protein